MEIAFLGHSSFRIKGKKVSLVTDPFDPEMVGLKFPEVSADIVTISHEHEDHNKAGLVSSVHKVISGPGEYEVLGASIIGISSFHDSKSGEERGRNTVYYIELEGIKLMHLGDLGHKLKEKQLEQIGEVDILFVPVGGVYTISHKEAVEFAQDLDAKLVFPMHYMMEGLNKKVFSDLAKVSDFTNALGVKTVHEKRFKVTRESLPLEQTCVVLSKT